MKTSALGISSIAAFLALAPLGAIPASANQQTAPGQIVKNGIAVPADSEVSVSSDEMHVSGTIGPGEGNKVVAFDENGLREISLPTEGRVTAAATSTYWKGGSSYVKNTESKQYFYNGESYASGKRDYVVPGGAAGSRIYRVTAACFWYTRDGKTLLGKTCSTTGANYAPGKVATGSVTDTLNPVAPKTQFHNDFTIKETG